MSSNVSDMKGRTERPSAVGRQRGIGQLVSVLGWEWPLHGTGCSSAGLDGMGLQFVGVAFPVRRGNKMKVVMI